MNFTGKWRCRNGEEVVVSELLNMPGEFIGVQGCPNAVDYRWNAEGNSSVGRDWDLMERISEKDSRR